jgi:hypothetical protein
MAIAFVLFVGLRIADKAIDTANRFIDLAHRFIALLRRVKEYRRED